MSIAEQILRAKNDYDDVYGAGYEKGKAEGGGGEIETVEKTVSGENVVRINDVAEVPHDVEVQLSSPNINDFSGTKVSGYGKNLANIPDIVRVNGNTTITIPCYITEAITISCVNDNAVIKDASGAVRDIWRINLQLQNGTTHSILDSALTAPVTYTKASESNPIVSITYRDTYLISGAYRNIQIERGNVATEYEPYKEPIEVQASADGKVTMPSISPTMIIMANANITVVYKTPAEFQRGKQAEYDAFWDAFQAKGYRVAYTNAFRNTCWTDECYNPKYPIAPKNGAMASMFQTSELTDTKVPIIHTGGNCTGVFNGASKMVTIRELSVVESTTFSSWFNNCTNLENITITGTIGQDLDVHWSPKLSADSIRSIIGALSETSTGKTLTLSSAAVNSAFSGDMDEWRDYLSQVRPNWTISLV